MLCFINVKLLGNAQRARLGTSQGLHTMIGAFFLRGSFIQRAAQLHRRPLEVYVLNTSVGTIIFARKYASPSVQANLNPWVVQ